jgi:hypothetical protein
MFICCQWRRYGPTLLLEKVVTWVYWCEFAGCRYTSCVWLCAIFSKSTHVSPHFLCTLHVLKHTTNKGSQVCMVWSACVAGDPQILSSCTMLVKAVNWSEWKSDLGKVFSEKNLQNSARQRSHSENCSNSCQGAGISKQGQPVLYYESDLATILPMNLKSTCVQKWKPGYR